MSSIVISDINLTLDDFLQLQSLLNHEQSERDRHIEACHQHSNKLHAHPVHHQQGHPIKFRRAINPQAARESQLEKQRLTQALLTLQYLKDQYRRQRAAEIQAYLEEYRRQALIRAVLQEEEERYYRQCIAAALEQRRVNLLWQRFLEAKQQENLMQQLQGQELNEQRQIEEQEEAIEEDGNMSSDSEEDDEGYSEYHSQQLANLLKQIFGQQHQTQEQEGQDAQEDPEIASPPTSAAIPTNVNVSNKAEDEQTSMAEVWKLLNEQKADSETPRTAFLPSEQDRVLGSGEEKEKDDHQDTQEINQQKDEQQETDSIGSPSSLSDNDQTKALPPLQDHVVTLQDLIQKLAAEPVLVGEQYNKQEASPLQPFASKSSEPLREDDATSPSSIAITGTTANDKDDKNKEEQTKKAFLPQQIVTEAEPTPTRESMPSTPADNASIKDDSHFADTVAAEQQNQEKPKDPRKEKAVEELDRLTEQLSESNDIVKRWNQVLSNASNLSFSKQAEGTFLLTASSDTNRQFLGSEDEIMRIMLKLDSIDSFGDDDIRQRRKGLVKKCERMLEELDQIKKNQWEKAVSSNKQQAKSRRRRNKKKKHHHKK